MPKSTFRIEFANKAADNGQTNRWYINVSRDMDCHIDDKPAVRKELMNEEIKKRWPKAAGFVQNIVRVGPK